MSGAPGREYHVGNRGPDFHLESLRKKRHGSLWDRPRAAESWGLVPLDTHPQPQRTGRDPHDKVTMELPLWPDVEPLRVAAEGCWLQGSEAASWLLLMQWAGWDAGIVA